MIDVNRTIRMSLWITTEDELWDQVRIHWNDIVSGIWADLEPQVKNQVHDQIKDHVFWEGYV